MIQGGRRLRQSRIASAACGVAIQAAKDPTDAANARQRAAYAAGTGCQRPGEATVEPLMVRIVSIVE